MYKTRNSIGKTLSLRFWGRRVRTMTVFCLYLQIFLLPVIQKRNIGAKKNSKVMYSNIQYYFYSSLYSVQVGRIVEIIATLLINSFLVSTSVYTLF